MVRGLYRLKRTIRGGDLLTRLLTTALDDLGLRWRPDLEEQGQSVTGVRTADGRYAAFTATGVVYPSTPEQISAVRADLILRGCPMTDTPETR